MSTLINPYCTLKNVQSETRNIDPNDADTIIDAINQASRWIDWYCRRDFGYHDHRTTSLVVDSSWCALNVIFLPWPTIELTEVRIVQGGGTISVLEPQEYRFVNRQFSAGSQIIRNGLWTANDSYENVGLSHSRLLRMPAQIELKGIFGYTPASTDPSMNPSAQIPAEVVQACTVIAAVRSGLSHREFVDPSGARQSVALTKVPTDVLDMLRRHRTPII